MEDLERKGSLKQGGIQEFLPRNCAVGHSAGSYCRPTCQSGQCLQSPASACVEPGCSLQPSCLLQAPVLLPGMWGTCLSLEPTKGRASDGARVQQFIWEESSGAKQGQGRYTEKEESPNQRFIVDLNSILLVASGECMCPHSVAEGCSEDPYHPALPAAYAYLCCSLSR